MMTAQATRGGAMATLDELRVRSDALFTELLKAQATERPAQPSPRRPAAPDAPPYRFSWFDLEDGVAAAALSFRFAALAASGETVEEGLSAALDDAEEEKERVDPEEVQIALALFVTHNDDGRRLAKPRAVAAAPELFSPPAAEDGLRTSVSVGGLSPGLDYWREDALANEHHQHWHQVYPWPGLQPRRFADWVTQRTPDELVAILNGIQPDPGWPNVVATSTPTELAATFVRVLRSDAQTHANRVFRLPRNLYALLFRLNDRQGELFFYMHEQMLARYDAELLSHGLERVAPFGPDEWDDPIAAGHNPVGLPFGHRDANVTLPSGSAAKLHSRWDEIDDALRTKRLRGLGGTSVPIDRENLGEAVESTVPQLRALAENAYNQPHGSGHVEIAHLSKADDGTPKDGVMITPAAAIRDPVFWQWHKAIDNLSARWQEGLEPYRFDDNPPVRLRNALDPGATTPWTSPDIILCRTSDLPAGADPAQLGAQLFGGESWSTDFTAAHASADGTTLQTIDELTTTMRQVAFGGRQIQFLTHEPFSYFLRIENTSGHAVGVTVRIFLVPADLAAERRAWMEMDKFLVDLPAGKQVVYRPDTESSIVKRPTETSPASVTAGGSGPGENSYCDCGWPYPLLLPRGKENGMLFRLLVFCTDAAVDRVPHQEHCGSMSYCGAVDRYPDTRDMGYPFSRPFAPGATAIQDTFVALECAAARSVTIRHV
jgi:hypothetical protein